MMKSRNSITAFCIWLIVVSAVYADDEWSGISHEWDAALNETMAGRADPKRLETAAQVLREWQKQQGVGFKWKNEQQREKLELIDFHLAKAWARAGDYENALSHLKIEIQAQAGAGGGLLYNTRNPDWFAMDVFMLHSEIVSQIGSAASIPNSGYEMFRIQGSDGKDRYAFVFRPHDDDEGGVVVGNVAADEERRIIQLTSPGQSGRYGLADRAEVVAKKGLFSVRANDAGAGTTLILGGVSKFVEYIGAGVPVVRPSPRETISLKVQDGNIEQPLQVLGLPSVTKESAVAPPVDRPQAGGYQDPNTTPLQTSSPDSLQADRNNETKTPGWLAIAGLGGAAIVILGGVVLWLRSSRRPD